MQLFICSFEKPKLLCPCKKEELLILRGNGSGKLKEWDRVYDYTFYNNLEDPNYDLNDGWLVLGGSSEYPILVWVEHEDNHRIRFKI